MAWMASEKTIVVIVLLLIFVVPWTYVYVANKDYDSFDATSVLKHRTADSLKNITDGAGDLNASGGAAATGDAG
jgi:hypothetical protein